MIRFSPPSSSSSAFLDSQPSKQFYNANINTTDFQKPGFKQGQSALKDLLSPTFKVTIASAGLFLVGSQFQALRHSQRLFKEASQRLSTMQASANSMKKWIYGIGAVTALHAASFWGIVTHLLLRED